MMLYNRSVKNVNVDELSDEETIEIFSDGRMANPLLEALIPKWFPTLQLRKANENYTTYVDGGNNRYLLRMFSNVGCKFMASKHVGIGREYDEVYTRNKLSKRMIILANIIDFPHVQLKFITGLELYNKYPTATIPVYDQSELFK